MMFGCVRAPGAARVVAMAGIARASRPTVSSRSSSPAEAARRKRTCGGGGGYSPPYAAMVVDVKTGRSCTPRTRTRSAIPPPITKVMTLYLLFEQLERGSSRLDTPLQVSAQRRAPGALQARPRARRDHRGRGRDQGARHQVGERRRRRRRREPRRLRGGLRRDDDPQGARARHVPDRLPQRLRPARPRTGHDRPRPDDPRPRHPGPLPALLPLFPDPRLPLRRPRRPATTTSCSAGSRASTASRPASPAPPAST